ncbi:tuliposide A-converting enzyme 2 [Carex littledalei]|uniref:Tuliposide A-converting enzyme 2 n=1 Tax=Carex littledalei TaxID=544730 RepID=A0A833RHE2_9POAL|nr:tuliposide A-converting enzyme 2 [Carex littledalei]
MVWRERADWFGVSRSREEGEEFEILAVCVPRESETTGLDDPFMNPMAVKEQMEGVYKCEKVLVAVAQKDELRDRGKLYYDKLLEAVSSGKWNGHVEFYETEGEDHVFYLQHNTSSDKAVEMMQKVVSFID